MCLLAAKESDVPKEEKGEKILEKIILFVSITAVKLMRCSWGLSSLP